MNNTYKHCKYLLIIVLIVLSYSYIYNLGGDLSYLKRYGDFGDEGYWLQNPISKIRFDNFLIDDQSQSFFGAPIYNYSIYLFLKYFGISFFTARLTSIILLLLTCYVVFKILLKFDFNKYSSILISISFALLYDNRINYQWSTPIPLEILFQSIFIYHLMFNKLTNFKSITKLIILFILCYNSKATSIFLFPLSIGLIILDNYKKSSLYKRVLHFVIPTIIFFFLRNYLFNYFFHDKYESFNKFLFTTIKLDIIQTISNLNPYYLIRSSIETFKFPNSTLIYTVITYIILKNLKHIFNLNKLKSFFYNNRSLSILILYIFFYITYLFILNSYGVDRRQINLILPLFLLFIILLPKINLTNNRLLFLFLFVSLYLIQAVYLFHFLQFDSKVNGFKIFVYIFVITILFLSCLTIYITRTHNLFLIFIVTNLFYHILFNRNTETLRFASHSIAKNINSNLVITGVSAHQLSIENNFIPIWWLNTNIHTTYPNWNSNYHFFRKHDITVVSTDMRNNLNNGYFNSVPINFKLFRSDTIFLHPKFDKSGYLDTNIINYYKYKQ